MSTIYNRFKLTALSAAMLTAYGTAYAQESTNNAEDETNLEEVIVTGIRASLEKSIDDKRFAKNIVDTINAEDIGKTSDQNIAEALSRVTGVSLQTRDGEGTTITVRGANANQNNITLNGATLTSTDFSQAVDLSAYSADILSKVEVVKTPSADHDEGSLGANVNLVTAKPLEIKEDVRSVTVQGRYNDFVDDTNHKISGSFSQTFLDDSLGIIVTAYDETSSIRRDQFRVGDYVTSNTARIARDQNGEVITNVRAIVPADIGYELHQNESNRQGLTTGIQWAPTDTTDIMLNLTHSEQSLINSSMGTKTRRPNNPNFFEGEEVVPGFPLAPFSDPQEDWWTIDTETRTLTKYLNRSGPGDITSSEGGYDNTNSVASLEIDQDITDTFRVSAKAGYSKSKQTIVPDNAWLNMQNYMHVPAQLLMAIGPYGSEGGIEPVGYDCTSGNCEIVFGQGYVDLGENTTAYEEVDEDGVVQQRPSWYDNTATSSFNPQDIRAQGISYLSRTDRIVEDKNQSFQLDFDLDVDKFGLTVAEFGAKYAKREKFVDNQTYQFSSSEVAEVIRDAQGNPLAIPGGSLLEISGESITTGEDFPYDNFMESLGYGRDNATIGWTPISGVKALELTQGSADVIGTRNDTETRNTEIDSIAAYLKTSFSFMDERLTGDIGLRYVETEVLANGYSGFTFASDRGNNLERVFDHVKLAELRDTSLPECPSVETYWEDPSSPLPGERAIERIDGLGFNVTAGAPDTWEPIPDAGACHEPMLVQRADFITSGATGEAPIVNWETMLRHADISQSHLYAWGANFGKEFDENGSLVNTNQEDRSIISIPTTNSHKYTNILPSLNLNYIIQEDLIGRFAISKTMARAPIDQLRPGFSGQEDPWPGRSNNLINMYNTKLDALESKNIDISLEWYFDDSAMVAGTLFHKDMTNFATVESLRTYVDDLRNLDTSVPYDSSQLARIATASEADNYGLDGCFPKRSIADFPFDTREENWSDDMRELCAQFNVNKTTNGSGATVSGIELQYTQTYDFLPSYWSGLGTSINYTYQDSSYDEEQSSIDSSITLPSLPVADTPEHSYNATVFWEHSDVQLRLAYRGNSDSLVGVDGNNGRSGRTWNQGSLWNEGRSTLDFSASWQVTDAVDLTFQAINLTDTENRTYFTSRTLEIDPIRDEDGTITGWSQYNEGTPMDNDATTSRTVTRYKNGRTFRLGVRVNF